VDIVSLPARVEAIAVVSSANKCVNTDRFTRHFVLGKTAGYANRYISGMPRNQKQIKKSYSAAILV